MRKLVLASALLLGLSIARPAAAHAGFFFSFSEPGFGIAFGTPFHRPAYHYPPPPVVYVPPPIVYGGYYRPRHFHHPHKWGYDRRHRGHRWR
jgi:hypothetical protein